MLHKPICYQTKGTVSNLYWGAMFDGAVVRGMDDSVFQVLILTSSRHLPKHLIPIRLGAEGATWRTFIHLTNIYCEHNKLFALSLYLEEEKDG